MASVVYKYELELCFMNVQRLRLPVGAKILTAQNQLGSLMLWALVGNMPDILEERKFRVVPTGVQYEKPGTYIATAQKGPLVFHIFEEV